MIEILYQDAALAVCIKPAGIASQGEDENALPALLQKQLNCEILPVHRLDQPVGGVMVFARTPKAAAELSRQMQQGGFEKEYLAVLTGRPEQGEDTLQDLLFFDRSRNKSFVVRRKRTGVKDASLSYRVMASSPEGLTLVRVRLHTGRTHQIRVQFASRKLPLLGDGKYGSRDNRCEAALFSCRLSFSHPETGRSLCFTALPPAQFPWNLFTECERP